MKSTFLKLTVLALATLYVLSSCSKSETEATPEAPSNFIIATSVTTAPFSGYLTSFGSTIPTGSVSNIKTSSRQGNQLLGFRTFGKNAFRMNNDAGERGITKYEVDATGGLKEVGFIAVDKAAFGSGQFIIMDATSGFYWDPALGLLKLQKFNPTTMQRTGELDFTSKLQDNTKQYVSLGQNMIMAKDGKLYANIHYGTTARKGYLDAQDGVIRLAVIDIATGNYEKTISINSGGRSTQIGWFNENEMWDLGDDGHLYFCNLGALGAGGSTVHRIKKGESEIDANWILKMDDITKNGFFHNLLIKGGKLYTRIPTEGIKPDFSNIGNEIWEYSAVDINTKAITKISGIPVVSFNGNANAIVEVNNEIYCMVVKASQNLNGFFKITGTNATQSFQVTEGGSVCGFAGLK
ncbi:MAG: hypothetical protein MUF58_05550 [Arcicella sp.]|jgi:hypothetical protein|nr:hypothetical protein [Arcicella sp.]